MKVRKHLNTKLLGKLKVWQTRLATYVAMINFLMIFYLYIIESPLNLGWYVWLSIILILVVGLILFDTLLVLPASQEYMFLKNPEWVKFIKQWKEVYPTLQKLQKSK